MKKLIDKFGKIDVIRLSKYSTGDYKDAERLLHILPLVLVTICVSRMKTNMIHQSFHKNNVILK